MKCPFGDNKYGGKSECAGEDCMLFDYDTNKCLFRVYIETQLGNKNAELENMKKDIQKAQLGFPFYPEGCRGV